MIFKLSGSLLDFSGRFQVRSGQDILNDLVQALRLLAYVSILVLW